MSYNILEAKIEFKNGQPERITVLVEISEGDVRAIFATTKPANGYFFLLPGTPISDALFQKIAGQGCETVDRDKIFQNWNEKYPVSRTFTA